MSNIIEIKYEEIDNNKGIIREHLMCDGFIKILFDDKTRFSEMMKVTKDFFYLPQEDKNTMQKHKFKIHGNVYYGYFPSNINGKEGLDVPNPNMNTKDYVLCEQITYPKSFNGKNVIDDYFNFCHELGTKIIKIVLGEHKATELCDNNDHLSMLRLNYYPKHNSEDDCVENSGGVKLACDTHVDDSLITLLYQDNTPGLQIQDKYTKEWHDVSPSTNSILINSGKLLEMITKGKYNPVNHRVLQNYKERISIPYFMCIPPLSHINDEYKLYHDYFKNFQQKKEYAYINTLLKFSNILS